MEFRQTAVRTKCGISKARATSDMSTEFSNENVKFVQNLAREMCRISTDVWNFYGFQQDNVFPQCCDFFSVFTAVADGTWG